MKELASRRKLPSFPTDCQSSRSSKQKLGEPHVIRSIGSMNKNRELFQGNFHQSPILNFNKYIKQQRGYLSDLFHLDYTDKLSIEIKYFQKLVPLLKLCITEEKGKAEKFLKSNKHDTHILVKVKIMTQLNL